MLVRQDTSPGRAAEAEGAARAGTDVILLFCRIGMTCLFYVSIRGKLANIDGFVAGLTARGVPGGMAMGYLAVTVEILGTLGVLLGLATRQAALLLAVFVVVATMISHRYWELPPDQAPNQMTHFYKNVSIFAGYLLLYVTGPGRYSLDRWLGRTI